MVEKIYNSYEISPERNLNPSLYKYIKTKYKTSCIGLCDFFFFFFFLWGQIIIFIEAQLVFLYDIIVGLVLHCIT
jgi:hypothetical protein